MAVFKCKMCGAPINIEGHETVITCEYCNRSQTLPKLNDEKRVLLYDRANHFRRNNEFDKAAAIYEQILMEDNTDAETYWSLVLCKYGIEYVEEDETKKRYPTVNRAQYTSVYDDDNYKCALKYADVLQKAVYEEEAHAINEIQKGILEISQKEEPFDVFICYKETGADGRRTPDSVLATELYQQLTREGFKVFFARITLESKLGTAYEPYIFAALNSAKVMVVLGTKPEHFNAVWVKNEWSRFLSLIKGGAEKLLIPAYRDMDPYDLPDEFSHLQAQDMSKLGFMQDLTYGITKIVRPKKDEPAVATAAAPKSTASNSSALLERAFMFLEDKNWKSASEYSEKVLDVEPKNAEAYLVKLLVELKVSNKETLEFCEKPFDGSLNYEKVIRFGTPSLKGDLENYNRIIIERNNNNAYMNALSLMEQAENEKQYKNAADAFRRISSYRDSESLAQECFERAEICRKDKIYDDAMTEKSADTIKNYQRAYDIFKSISGWKDADSQAEDCNNRKQILEKNKIYENARSYMQRDTNNGYFYAIEEFSKIPGWRDSDELLKVCEQRIQANKEKEEAERLAKEKAEVKARRKVKRKKRTKRLIKLTFVLVILGVVGFFVANKFYFEPLEKYNEAVELLEDGKYSDALEIFVEISDFKDTADKIIECSYGLGETSAEEGDLITAAIALGKCGDYKDARERSRELWNDIAFRETVSMGSNHIVAVKEDGSVIATGNNSDGQCDVQEWSDIIAVSAGSDFTLGLKADGTVVATGYNEYDKCEVGAWTDIVAISAGETHALGLKSDGTVVSSGSKDGNRRDVDDWENIIAIDAYLWQSIALTKDRRVISTDANFVNDGIEGWENVCLISASTDQNVGIDKYGNFLATFDEPLFEGVENVRLMDTGSNYTVLVDADGSVHLNCSLEVYDWWGDVVSVSAGEAGIVALRSDGTVRYVVKDSYESENINVSDWSGIKMPSNTEVIAVEEETVEEETAVA